MTYAIAAAGTGGHVYPAIAVADALLEGGVARNQILFVGGSRLAATAVPAAGYDYLEVEIRGLRRSLSLDNLTLPSVVWRASKRIETELRHRSVTAAIGFGGYISVPTAWAARRVGADYYVHEQNAVPGVANRLVSRRAKASFIAFPEAADQLRRSQLVGNPLRSALAHYNRDQLRPAALEHYGLAGDRPILGVLGGSLGAKVLNEATGRVADALDQEEVAIVHLTGHAHYESVSAVAAGSAQQWKVLPFEDHMEHFYAVSDVVLSRAGALTVSELAATGTPAVMVPYAAGAAGHQAANAAHLAEAGGAELVAEDQIDRVPVLLQQLIADTERRNKMAKAAASVGKPDAAQVIARSLLDAIGPA
ncbi:MAG: UDP-N-acetylglucosamine--N-acetylmuramyl-(pentapeptide) pyrophosphoryl-undecaprenol N-acetylglucosamine transferase [Acidimicrobiia bacterium]|nr:UDP-N-acetylglucosamine--N-acetylmuramyl-(pentapeptide) pyrophosphoryl-undecaprenol N-acetylglucosamine transferase [Acidimicrobiia bacterium]